MTRLYISIASVAFAYGVVIAIGTAADMATGFAHLAAVLG